MSMLKPGIYQHYKGNQYQVLLVARDSETEQEMVVYQALYGERGHWVRPLAMFTQRITVEGQEQPRFAFIQ